MKVFIPHQKDRNIYLDQIIKYSECDYIFGNYVSFDASFEIVNIQFPEAIFNGIPPTREQLNDLEEKIISWKKKSKIVLTLNDLESHYDGKNKFIDLFRLLQKQADAVIHLGNYSLEKYKNLFSIDCKHTVIYHPLYESLIQDCKIADFQDKFKLELNDKYVVSVIGSIRSMEEVEFILKVFKKIPIKNKLLIVPNMLPFWQIPRCMPYRFRKIYKWIVEKKYCCPLRKDQYFFGYNFIDYSSMIDLVKKSSLIIIPRIRNLNSGNLYLGLTFDKPMVIPKIGNLTEVADYFNLPVLDLEKNNYFDVVNKLRDVKTIEFFESTEYFEKKNKFRSCEIAKEYDMFFNKIINN
jgi:hypothetical protein